MADGTASDPVWGRVTVPDLWQQEAVAALRAGQGLLVSGTPEDVLARSIGRDADASTGDARRGDPSEVDFGASIDDEDDDFLREDDDEDPDEDADVDLDEEDEEDDEDDEDDDGFEAADGLGTEDGEESGAEALDPSLDPAPGPVEVAGSDSVHVSRVRVDPRRPTAVAMWITFDEVRRGVARNLVAILETLADPEA